MLETSVNSASVLASSQGGGYIKSPSVKASLGRFLDVVQKNTKLNQQALDKGLQTAFDNGFDANQETSSRITRIQGVFKDQSSGSISNAGVNFLALEVGQKDENGDVKSLYFSLSGEPLETVNLDKTDQNNKSGPLLSTGAYLSLNNVDALSEALSEQRDEAQKVIQRLEITQKALKAYRSGDYSQFEAFVSTIREQFSSDDGIPVGLSEFRSNA